MVIVYIEGCSFWVGFFFFTSIYFDEWNFKKGKKKKAPKMIKII